MLDLIVVVEDCDSTYQGELILPGEPYTIGEFENGCSFCGDVLVASPGEDITDHAGFLEFKMDHSVMYGGETVHLRCAVDTINMGSMGIIAGNTEFASTGRHLASA